MVLLGTFQQVEVDLELISFFTKCFGWISDLDFLLLSILFHVVDESDENESFESTIMLLAVSQRSVFPVAYLFIFAKLFVEELFTDLMNSNVAFLSWIDSFIELFDV